MHKIETNLKSKFKATIAQVHQAIANLDKKFEQYLTQHIANIQSMQVDKTMQEKHTQS